MIKTAIIYAKLQRPTKWEDEDKNSYNVQRLTAEYRDQLYSEEAKNFFFEKDSRKIEERQK